MTNNMNNNEEVLAVRNDGPLDMSQLYHAISETGYEFAFFVLPPRLWCASPEEMDRPVTAPPLPRPPENNIIHDQIVVKRPRAKTV